MSDINICERCGHEHKLTCADLACQMITIEERMDNIQEMIHKARSIDELEAIIDLALARVRKRVKKILISEDNKNEGKQ